MKLVSLKKNFIFSKAYKKGNKSVKRSVCVYCLDKPRPKDSPVLGITVSTKLGGAVQRNRAKRVIRAAYREIINERAVYSRYIVAVARSCCYDGTVNSREVKEDLVEAFRELKITGGSAG